MYNKCSIFLLPTNEKSNIHKIGNELGYTIIPNSNFLAKQQHLYITSDEEIKEGDWCYHPEISQEYTIINKGVQTKGLHPAKGVIQWKDTTNEWYKKARKIIATDASLRVPTITTWNDGEQSINKFPLPQIPQQFIQYYIEEYNKGNIITEVEVEYVQVPNSVFIQVLEAPYIQLKVNSDNTINIKPIKDSWTREEHVADLYKAYKYGIQQGLNPTTIPFDEWIKENL